MTKFLPVTARSAACALLLVTSASAQERRTGLVFASDVQRSRIPLAAVPFGAGSPPPEVDWSFNFPAPGQQGQANSCVGWAAAYLKAYQERVEARFSGETVPQMFSPAFIYNQINRGIDGGSNIPDALRLLSGVGAVSSLLMPYRAGDHTTQPSRSLVTAARRYRIDSYRQVNVDDVKEVQAHLGAGFPVIIGVQVDGGFKRLGSGQVWRTQSGPAEGGHAMVIVGYSEARRAFKVINSWGTSWGENGFGWIDFDHFRQVVREGYVTRDAVNSGPATPEPAPVPTPRPTPVPAPTPLTPPLPTPVRPEGTVSTTSADALLGIHGEAVPVSLLEVIRNKMREGVAITSVAMNPWGGWVVSYGGNGFTRSQLPRDLDSVLVSINDRRIPIRRIAISPTGAWIVLRGSPGGWAANGLRQTDYAELRRLTNAGEAINDAGFLSDGTLLVMRGRNGWWASGTLPVALDSALRTLNTNRELVTHVAFGPQRSWLLIRYENGDWFAGMPDGAARVLANFRAANQTVGYAALLPNGGWLVIRQR